ncbi:MAG: hypothetical protein IKD61_00510 [Oscillospiraceae bacterium]|nr:hypothetical protein [Oscillospiraceae bacterium]
MQIISTIIEETIELTTKAGEVMLRVPVKLNVTQLASQIRQKQLELQAAAESKDETSIGRAFVELCQLCLGEAPTEQLLDFYADDYATMLTDLTPFFTDVIYPEVRAAHDRLMGAAKRVKAS